MTYVWSGLAIAGLCLTYWAYFSLPAGTDMMPRPPKKRVKTGPYRLMKHPMYTGNVAIVAGLGGLAGGWLNALAVGSLAEMLMQHWIGLEEGR